MSQFNSSSHQHHSDSSASLSQQQFSLSSSSSSTAAAASTANSPINNNMTSYSNGSNTFPSYHHLQQQQQQQAPVPHHVPNSVSYQQQQQNPNKSTTAPIFTRVVSHHAALPITNSPSLNTPPPTPLLHQQQANISSTQHGSSATHQHLNKPIKYSFYKLITLYESPDSPNSPIQYLHFIYLIANVLLFYILAGITQEFIFREYKHFKLGWFMTWWQFGAYWLLAGLMRTSWRVKRRRQREEFQRHHQLDLLHHDGGSGNASPPTPHSRNIQENILLHSEDDHWEQGDDSILQRGATSSSSLAYNRNASPSNAAYNNKHARNYNLPPSFELQQQESPTAFGGDNGSAGGGGGGGTFSYSLWKRTLFRIVNISGLGRLLPSSNQQNSDTSWKIIILYMTLASLSVLGMGFGNQSLNYLNYPTKILFKSCKLLSVMLVGLVLLGKRYNRMDYLASISLIAGLFTLYTANRAVNIELNLTGVVFMVLALLSDSVTSNFQEKLLQEYDQTPLNLIFYVHGLGFFHLLFVCLATHQLQDGIRLCLEQPSLIAFMLLYSAFSFIGAQFLHSLTKRSSVIISLTVTSVRKVFSILISFFIFPKPIHYGHFVAMLLVFVGVALRVLNKQKGKAKVAPISVNTSNKDHSA